MFFFIVNDAKYANTHTERERELLDNNNKLLWISIVDSKELFFDGEREKESICNGKSEFVTRRRRQRQRENNASDWEWWVRESEWAWERRQESESEWMRETVCVCIRWAGSHTHTYTHFPNSIPISLWLTFREF